MKSMCAASRDSHVPARSVVPAPTLIAPLLAPSAFLIAVPLLGVLVETPKPRRLAPIFGLALGAALHARTVGCHPQLVLAVLTPVDVDGGDLGFRVIQAPECLRREARAHDCSGSKGESECLRTWLG